MIHLMKPMLITLLHSNLDSVVIFAIHLPTEHSPVPSAMAGFLLPPALSRPASLAFGRREWRQDREAARNPKGLIHRLRNLVGQ